MDLRSVAMLAVLPVRLRSHASHPIPESAGWAGPVPPSALSRTLTVLDADLIIAYVDAGDAHHAAARAIVAGADELAASVLTLGESAVDAVRADRLDRWQQAMTALQVRPVALPADCAPALARLRAETALRMPDCCVLHAGLTLGADAIGTRDRRLRSVAGELGFETP